MRLGQTFATVRDTYGLPRQMPVQIRLIGFTILSGIPIPLLWWLVLPKSAVVVGVLTLVELVIVFGGLWRILTARTFHELPRDGAMQPPSTQALEPPGASPPAPPAISSTPATTGHHSGCKVLIVASEGISSQQLRDAIQNDPAQLEVMVIAPALHNSMLRFWMSDADEAIAHAKAVKESTVTHLQQDGIEASGDTAEGAVSDAVEDALVTFPADRILLFVHAEEGEKYRERIDAERLAQKIGIPVQKFLTTGNISSVV